MVDAIMGQAPNNHNIFRALIKGVLIGFPIALLFVIASALLLSFGLNTPFLTSPADMGLLGMFVGIGLEIYPLLF